MKFQDLINRLREDGHVAEANALRAEVDKEFASGATSTIKRIKKTTAEAQIAGAVKSLLTDSEPVAASGYKLELARNVAAILKEEAAGRPRRPTPAPPAKDGGLAEAIKAGHELRVKFSAEEGVFTARMGNVVADGGTYEDAVAALTDVMNNKLSQEEEPLPTLRQAGSTEYSSVSKRDGAKRRGPSHR